MPKTDMEKIRIEKEIDINAKYDVIVAGGGVAGVAAAVSEIGRAHV